MGACPLSESRTSNDVDFSGLILGFSSAALHYLGEHVLSSTETSTNSAAANLPLARQNIEIIELLRIKTQGNLSEDEQKLITQVLSDLRLKFVEVSKRK